MFVSLISQVKDRENIEIARSRTLLIELNSNI